MQSPRKPQDINQVTPPPTKSTIEVFQEHVWKTSIYKNTTQPPFRASQAMAKEMPLLAFNRGLLSSLNIRRGSLRFLVWVLRDL